MAETDIKFLSISDLNKIISDRISELEEFEVEGEIFEWKMFSGKMFYFKLKDEKSSISAMTNIFQLTNWRDLEEGMLVRAKVSIKFNQSKGALYLWVEEMSPHGEGALKIALEKLKKRLQTEGLFSPERKRPVVRYPQKVGLITSKDGAAINDFKKILNARSGGLKVYFYPVKVEGREAIPSILAAFDYYNNFKEQLDAIILIRGGGSLENLQAFNDERVARGVAGSRFPIICGIGHEHDVSICDLCADLRASTPSNAAELLVEDKAHTNQIIITLAEHIKAAIKLKASGVADYIGNTRQSMKNSVGHELKDQNLAVSELSNILFRFRNQFGNIEQQIKQISELVKKTFTHKIEISNQYLSQSVIFLNSVSPKNIMSMGYSVVKDHSQKIVRSSEQLEISSELSAFFYKGSIQAKVTKREV